MAPSTAHQIIKQLPRSANGDRGSALIVSLVLLLVITVTGIAGMSGAVLQERMAGNLQDGTQMFETTEAVLRRCSDRVLNDNSMATGTASAQAIQDFRNGDDASLSSGAGPAEYFAPDSLSDNLAAQGGSSYQMACLIEFNGPIDAATLGYSLRQPQPAADVVGYNVMVAGARNPPSDTNRKRPSKLLEARVVLQR